MANITIFHWRDKAHPEKGGSTLNIVHVAEQLATKGHHITFLTERYSPQLPKAETIAGVTYIRRGQKLSQFLILPWYYFWNLRKNTDVILEAYDAWPFMTPMLGSRVIMLICHIQREEWSMEFGSVLGPILGRIARFMLKAFYRKADIVAISESTRDSIIQEGITSKSLSIIPVGVEELMYAESLKEKPTDRVICCTPSRLRSHKQFDIAIQLIADYNTQMRSPTDPFVYFDIVGAGDHEPFLRNLVDKLGVQSYVTFHGRAPDETKRDLLSRAHLHLQFSKREGWGITVLEAATQGVPTLCFDIPGLRDSVSEETGYLVSTKQELYKRFPEIIRSIAKKDASYTNRATRGYQNAQKYRWSTIDQQWEELIERVATGQAPT